MFYVCWIRPDNTYYYRLVKGTYKDYFIGYKNQYKHEVIMIIKLPPLKYRYNPFKVMLRKTLYRLYTKI